MRIMVEINDNRYKEFIESIERNNLKLSEKKTKQYFREMIEIFIDALANMGTPFEIYQIPKFVEDGCKSTEELDGIELGNS